MNNKIEKKIKHLKIIHPMTFDGFNKLLQLGKEGWNIFGGSDNDKRSILYLEKASDK